MEKSEMNTDFEIGKDNVEKVVARKKNKIALIIGIILVVLIVAVVSVVAFGGNSKRKLARQLDLAESYVLNLDYKAAIAEYKAAIELDSKCVDAYVGLAEVYVEMEEYEAAIKVLEDGYEETEQTTIRDMLGDVEKLLEEVQETEESEEQENETEDFSEEEASDSPVEENESADNSGAGKVTQGIELIFTDGTTALALFEEAADMGNEDAMFLAGYMLDWGNDYCGQKDYVRARQYYEMVEDSNPYALISLAFLYKNGQGVESNSWQAMEYVQKAKQLLDEAETANLEYACVAYSILGYYHREFDPNEELMKECFEKAAELGNTSGLCSLGYCYLYGINIEENYLYARDCFEIAANNGDSESMFWMGWIFRCGLGVETDFAVAKEWYEKAAALGEEWAMNELGYMYLYGEGVTPDSVVAGEWFERGAEAGDPSAMFNLGELYFNGDGVEQDYDIAEQWFRRAAELGNESAQNYLDEYYD